MTSLLENCFYSANNRPMQTALCNCPMPACPFSERPVNQIVRLRSIISKFQNLKYQNIILKFFMTSLLENCFFFQCKQSPLVRNCTAQFNSQKQNSPAQLNSKSTRKSKTKLAACCLLTKPVISHLSFRILN